MGKITFIPALIAAKLSVPMLKLTKHNGTNFPGELALKICPDFLRYIGKPKKIIAVTGTNGKTTVCNMTCDILEKSGKRVLHNRLGSNISSGIATSLINGCSLFNKPGYELAVFEVDERSALKIFRYVRPDHLVITNLFRDSIMRNAHPDYIADILTRAVPEGTKLILNADDLISCRVAPANERVYFGIGPMDGDGKECVNLINDMQICPLCSGRLEYEYRRYHHIGKAVCADCGFRSPAADYYASDVDLGNMRMDVRDSGGHCRYGLLSDSVFNIYNMLTVIALLRELGFSHDSIRDHMEKTSIVGTRYSCEKVGQVNVVMQMAKEKNALAGSRAFDYVSSRPGRKELLLMMNCLGDVKHWSENTCWLYDCDFEFLADENISQIVCTGARAKDYVLRLCLAGVDRQKIVCTEDEFDAAGLLNYTPGDSLYIFYGTDSLELAFRVREKVCAIAKEKAE